MEHNYMSQYQGLHDISNMEEVIKTNTGEKTRRREPHPAKGLSLALKQCRLNAKNKGLLVTPKVLCINYTPYTVHSIIKTSRRSQHTLFDN